MVLLLRNSTGSEIGSAYQHLILHDCTSNVLIGSVQASASEGQELDSQLSQTNELQTLVFIAFEAGNRHY